MSAPSGQRRLAAILVADVVGYSRLMEIDEAGTLERLKLHRAEAIDPKIAEHRGRIIKLMGDGALVEFASVVDAVAAAVAIQRAMRERNEAEPEARRIEFRIGVNLGDLIVDGDDLYGDGLNVAARLESLADPGGICVSAMVHQNVKAKLDLGFDDLGEQRLKNIAEPVRAYRIRLDGSGPLAGGPAMLLPLRDRPSIAVLPFTNMSGDPEQEYFSDGMTEDVITELARFRSLFVVSRNSSFHFKGRSENVQRVGQQLGVRYVVEGSVRKSGNRVRLTAQLVETASGGHLWAERYDRALEEIFEVQDELLQAIASAIPGAIDRQALEQARRKPPENLTAYECELRGRWAFRHWGEGLDQATKWFARAVDADPTYATALAWLARCYEYGVMLGDANIDEIGPKAEALIESASKLDDHNPAVHLSAVYVYLGLGKRDSARLHAQRACALNPNDPEALTTMALVLAYGGSPDEALEWHAKSEKLEPYAADDQRLDILCDTFYMLRQYDKVIQIHQAYRNAPPGLLPVLAAAYAQVGKVDEARKTLQTMEQRGCPVSACLRTIPVHLAHCSRPEDREHWLEGYRKAGLPV